MNNSTSKIDLRKQIVLDLKKKIGLDGQKAQVYLALDFSGSMTGLYNNGSVQELIERILPLGLAFDDNGEVDFYLFHDSFIKMKENITLSNVNGYINNKVINKYRMGGTSYAPVINDIVSQFAAKKGFMGFGKSDSKTLEYPVYVIFITDGHNSDVSAAEKAMRDASSCGVFFQFVGIGSSSFPFLEKLDNLSGRNIDNANFFKVDNLNRKSDDDLYALLLHEFPSFIREARQKNMIK